MPKFDNINYSGWDKSNPLYKDAVSADKNQSGSIDTNNEKSIFLNSAKSQVKRDKITAQQFNDLFGFPYSDDVKYGDESASRSGDVQSNGGAASATQDIPDDNSTDKPQGDAAYRAGNEVYHIIHGITRDYEYPDVDSAISPKHLDKTNIVKFLDGFYAGNSHEGIIEYLDDEHDGGVIQMTNKKNIILSLIARADELSLGDEREVKGLKSVLRLYNSTGKYKDATTFNHGTGVDGNYWQSLLAGTGSGAATGAALGLCGGPFAELTVPAGAAWGAAVGLAWSASDFTTHNEVIDEFMRVLHQKIKDKESEQQRPQS